MNWDFRHWWDGEEPEGEEPQRPAPGKVTLTSRLQPVQRRAVSGSGAPLDGIAYLAQPVQQKAVPNRFPDDDAFAMHLIGTPIQLAGAGGTEAHPDAVHAAAARGVEGPAGQLPHLDKIQPSFGRHDVSHVHAHVGGAAAEASTAMGATAYATGDHVAFASTPDFHTAAHEAAHVVQQKGGVQLKGGVGEEGDSYERHADAVADKVVRGESAEVLLDQMAGHTQGHGGDGAAATQSIQMKKGDAPAEGGPQATGLAAAADEVSEYAGFAYAALQRRQPPDSDLLRLNQKLGVLGEALHQHAGERGAADERALRKALRDAQAVADKLNSGHTGRTTHEDELRQRIGMIERLASGGEDRGAVDITATELRVQAEISLEQLERVRDRVYTVLAIDTSKLDATIEKTSGWIATLSQPDTSTADARKLSNAVLQQQALLFDLVTDLDDVLAKPGPSMRETVEAYVLAMSKSTERKSIAAPLAESARKARRRMPLARAAQMLEGDEVATLEINEIDPKVGGKAKGEHAAMEARHTALDKKLAGGRTSDFELRKFEVDAREQTLRHRTQLLEAQARQLAQALGDLAKITSNSFDLELARIRTDLLSLAEEFPYQRERYARRVEKAEDEHGGHVEGQWPLLRAREASLDELEGAVQRFLGRSEFLETLQAAQRKAESAQTRAFAQQLITTVALTLAGSAAAQLAKGTAEGAWLARSARAGATESEAAVIAARAETFGTVVSVVTDVAVNTAGQVAQGDDASLLTLLTLNAFSPIVIGRIQKTFGPIGRVNATAGRLQRLAVGAADFAHDKLVLSLEMIAGAAFDHASRTLLQARSQDPTEQQAEDWLYQGAAMAIGRHLSVRSKMIASRLEKLRTGARRAVFDALASRSEQLHGDSSALAMKGDTAAANKLLDAYERILADQSSLLNDSPDDVLPAGTKPKPDGGDPSGKTRAPDGDPARPDDAKAAGPVDPRLNQIDDNLYTADPRALTHIRDSLKTEWKGAKVGKIEYDPHANQVHFEVKQGGRRIFVTAEVPPRIMSAAELASVRNRVIGEPLTSLAVGQQVLRDVSAGRLQALAKVGVDVPDGMTLAHPVEFGLGKLADGRFVVVIGAGDHVDWNQVPGLKPMAHTHPSTEGNDLKKHAMVERVPLAKLFEATDAPMVARELIYPSPSDFRIMARKGVDGHRVITSFVLDDGHVSNAKPGDDSPRLEWVLRKPREIGETPDGDTVFETILVAEAGGKQVAQRKVWSVEPKRVQYEGGDEGPNVDPGSHFLSRPELAPRKSAAADHGGPEGARTRATVASTDDAGAAETKVTQLVSKRTGITVDKLTMNGHAAFEHVSVRADGDHLEVHYKSGTQEAAIVAAVDAHMRLAARRPKDIKDPQVVGPKGGKLRWTGADEAAFQGRPTAEKGYHWALHEGDLRYVREDVDDGVARPKRMYDDKKEALVDAPGRKGDNVFEKNASKVDAFDELGGHDPSEEFGAWVALVGKELGITKEQLIGMMTEPGGKTHRGVRHPIKDQVTPRLMEALTDRARLQIKYPDTYEGVNTSDDKAMQKADRAASHKAMLGMTARLGSADRGSIAERWYLKMYASPDAVAHIKFTKEEMAKQGITLTKDRVPDIIDGNRLKDVKHVTGTLDSDNQLQLNEFSLLVDRSLTVDGKSLKLESMSVAFTEPAGGAANASFIGELVARGPQFTAEIFNARGERRVISSVDLVKGQFNTVGGRPGLIQAIRMFTGS